MTMTVVVYRVNPVKHSSYTQKYVMFALSHAHVGRSTLVWVLDGPGGTSASYTPALLGQLLSWMHTLRYRVSTTSFAKSSGIVTNVSYVLPAACQDGGLLLWVVVPSNATAALHDSQVVRMLAPGAKWQ
jgi:hypothetical protein